jgi:hypothetical protein
MNDGDGDGGDVKVMVVNSLLYCFDVEHRDRSCCNCPSAVA